MLVSITYYGRHPGHPVRQVARYQVAILGCWGTDQDLHPLVLTLGTHCTTTLEETWTGLAFTYLSLCKWQFQPHGAASKALEPPYKHRTSRNSLSAHSSVAQGVRAFCFFLLLGLDEPDLYPVSASNPSTHLRTHPFTPSFQAPIDDGGVF